LLYAVLAGLLGAELEVASPTAAATWGVGYQALTALDQAIERSG